MSNAPRLRAFEPLHGKLAEVWMSKAEASGYARNPLINPLRVCVGTGNGRSETVLRTSTGYVMATLHTRQARRLAEAAVWVGAVLAMAALGEVGAITLDNGAPAPSAT